jgi:hypothetical protein
MTRSKRIHPARFLSPKCANGSPPFIALPLQKLYDGRCFNVKFTTKMIAAPACCMQFLAIIHSKSGGYEPPWFIMVA